MKKENKFIIRATIRKRVGHVGQLYPHQVEMLAELVGGKRYLMSAPRCGKTRPVIAFLSRFSGIKLVLTKKQAIKGWLSELEAMGEDLFDWKVVNYEQVRTAGWDHKASWGALVLDEAHSIGKYPKPNLCVKGVWNMTVLGPRIGISATPCAESYSQLFYQVKALRIDLWTEYKNFYAFHRECGVPDLIRANGRMLETYKRVKESVWESFRAHCCVVDRSAVVADFVDSDDHKVELEAPEILEMCHRLKRDGIIRVGEAVIVAETPLAVAQKCQQIASGVVLDDEGLPVVVNTVKLEWLRGFVGQKVAILTTFKAEVAAIEGKYSDCTDDFVEFSDVDYHGWFVGSIQRFNAGVDLSAAVAMVFTSCPWSSVQYLQARDRLLRRDRVMRAPVYFPVIAGGIDSAIYDVVGGEKRDFTAKQYALRTSNTKDDH